MSSNEAKLIPQAELLEKLGWYRKNKIWAGDYFVLNTEVQRRAVAIWTHEDVFGEPYEWDIAQQKFVVPERAL
jgi:hypothetical protein